MAMASALLVSADPLTIQQFNLVLRNLSILPDLCREAVTRRLPRDVQEVRPFPSTSLYPRCAVSCDGLEELFFLHADPASESSL
jgi:hypothetical protein